MRVQPAELVIRPRWVLHPGVLTAVVVERPTQGGGVEGRGLPEVVDRELHVIDHVRHTGTILASAIVPPEDGRIAFPRVRSCAAPQRRRRCGPEGQTDPATGRDGHGGSGMPKFMDIHTGMVGITPDALKA